MKHYSQVTASEASAVEVTGPDAEHQKPPHPLSTSLNHVHVAFCSTCLPRFGDEGAAQG